MLRSASTELSTNVDKKIKTPSAIIFFISFNDFLANFHVFIPETDEDQLLIFKLSSENKIQFIKIVSK